MMKRHPSKHDLLAYAEGRVQGRTEVSVRIAAHLARCDSCRGQAKAIYNSLAVADAAGPLKPSSDSTARILVAAQRERQVMEENRTRHRRCMAVLKAVGCAAGLLLAALLSYGSALNVLSPDSLDTTETSVAFATPNATGGGLGTGAIDEAASRLETLYTASPEALRKAAIEIRTLAAALNVREGAPQTLWERAQRQALVSLEADITAAMAALERNPGCVRAATVVNQNLQRQAQTLKTLYTEQSL